MNKDKIAYDELLKGIQNYVQKCVNDSGKDMTYTAVIKSVDSEGYTILLNGATYSGVKTIGGLCSANEVVNVLIPNGNYNNMIILKSGDSQGGGGISGDYLPLTGGVLTGDLTIGANLYVDGNVNFGENNEINGSYSVANGNGNTINGNYSHIEGLFNTSYEDGSHTEGYSTTNLSRFSHIEGYKGLLAESATGAHLEGYSEWSFEDMLTSSSKVETTVTSTSPYSFENVTLTNGISDSSYNSYYSSDSSVGWIVEYIDNEGEHNYAVVSRVNPVSNNCYLVPLKGHIYSMYAGDSVTIYKKMWTPYLFGYGDASHTEGYGNILMGAGCHAEGGYNILDTQGYSSYSHIEGYQNYGDYTYHSHIEGSYNTAKGKYEYNSLYNVHMEGGNNKATESYTHTEGYNNTASGYTGHVEGYGTKVLSSYGHAEGQYTVVGQSGYSGHAEGNYSQVNCSNGHAEGGYTEVTINGYCAHAEGANTKANNSNAHAEGYQTEANGYCSHSEGSFSKANNSNTHAEGYQTEANGYCSHSEGNYSVAHGEASHAEGYGIMALDYAHGEGYTTKAIGKYSHSENYLSMALGMSSHASGEQTVASGIQSFVQGYGSGTIADNNFVFVENTGNALKFEIQQPLESNELKGYVLTTVWQGNLLYLFNIEQSGNSYEIIDNYLYVYPYESYKLTNYTNFTLFNSEDGAIGDVSHAEGYKTKAMGYVSHSEGDSTIANGDGSHSEGLKTIANGTYQHTAGMLNIADTENKYATIIGNGYIDEETNDEIRSNAHTLDWDGNAWFAGDVTCNDEDGNLISLRDIATHGGGGGEGDRVVVTPILTEGTEIATIKVNNITQTLYTPTISEWALSPNKPTYTADEVGALADTTTLADINGDAEHRTVTDAQITSWSTDNPTYTSVTIGQYTLDEETIGKLLELLTIKTIDEEEY